MNIEERYDPPFTYCKHALGGYVVRPLNWEGIWKDGFVLVGGSSILKCDNEEDAKMMADTFNKYFDLIRENQKLKKVIKRIKLAGDDKWKLN